MQHAPTPCAPNPITNNTQPTGDPQPGGWPLTVIPAARFDNNHRPSRHQILKIPEHAHVAVEPRGYVHVAGRECERVVVERQAAEDRHAFSVSPVTRSWIGTVTLAHSTLTLRPALRPTLGVTPRCRIWSAYSLQNWSYPMNGTFLVRHESKYSACSSRNVTFTRPSSRCTCSRSSCPYTLSTTARSGNSIVTPRRPIAPPRPCTRRRTGRPRRTRRSRCVWTAVTHGYRVA